MLLVDSTKPVAKFAHDYYFCLNSAEVDDSTMTPPPIATFTDVLVPHPVAQKTPSLPSGKPYTSPPRTSPVLLSSTVTSTMVSSTVTSTRKGPHLPVTSAMTKTGATQSTHSSVHKPPQDQRGQWPWYSSLSKSLFRDCTRRLQKANKINFTPLDTMSM